MLVSIVNIFTIAQNEYEILNSHTPSRRACERSRVNVYTPILVLGILAFGFAAFSIVIASFTGPKRYNRAKYAAYECGIEPTPQPMGGGRFPVKFYLTAMMFIILTLNWSSFTHGRCQPTLWAHSD